MNNPHTKFTWKGFGLAAFALVLTYLGSQVVKDAAKEAGVSAALLAAVLGFTANRLPNLPEEA